MNRLIENARKRAWHLARLAEVADLEGRPAWVRMNRAEVNQIANTLNELLGMVCTPNCDECVEGMGYWKGNRFIECGRCPVCPRRKRWTG